MQTEAYHKLRATPLCGLAALTRHQIEAYARHCTCRTRLKLLAIACLM